MNHGGKAGDHPDHHLLGALEASELEDTRPGKHTKKLLKIAIYSGFTH
jgi:hypothetical protein